LPPAFGSRAPLVVALHGCTQTASDFAAGTRFDSVAERAGAYVVYPEQSVLRNPNRCWNWFDEANQFRERGEPAAILALVAETLGRHPVDPERVFVAGLSAGGAMAAILAEQAPDVFAAVGVMAGVALHSSRDVASAFAAMHGRVEPADIAPVLARLPPPVPPGVTYERMRATIWTGAHDRTVDPSNARTLATQFLRLLGVPESNEYREKRADSELVRWYDVAGRTRVETWLVRDMGHAWSGGSFRGSHTFPRGPRASDAMMEFFLGDLERAARPSLPAS
jgi:poly(hydroxyalkanoate) depolymerase family esterase